MSSILQMMLITKPSVGSASVSISPSSLSGAPSGGSSFSDTVTATPIGITSPTYAWSWLSGGSGFTLANTTSATVTVNSAARSTGTEQMGELKCTVSGTGGPASSSISVDVIWGV